MAGARQNLNGLRHLTTLLSVMFVVLGLELATIYQPAYQTWSLYLRPLRRYEKVFKVWKMWWFGIVMVTHNNPKPPNYITRTVTGNSAIR